MTTARRKRLLAAVIALAGLAVMATSLQTRRQLFALGGLTDDWMYLGANLRVSGTLGDGDRPLVLRPPGYPIFIAGLLAVTLPRPSAVAFDYMRRGAEIVYAAQALLMVMAGVALFVWLWDVVRPCIAVACGLILATSPYSMALVGLLHYGVLHLFLLTVSGLFLHRTLRLADPRATRLFALGLLFGAGTLVRATTLVLPALSFFLFLARAPRRPLTALRYSLLVAAGTLVVLVPGMVRNYRVADRLIPVNLQVWSVLWGSTVKPLEARADYYRWYELGSALLPVFTRVTGQATYSYSAFARHQVALEDEFKKEALRNIRERPRVYLGNSLGSLKTLMLDMNGLLIDAMRFSQPPRPWIDAMWFQRGQGPAIMGSALGQAFSLLAKGLTLLAAAGLFFAARRWDVAALTPIVLFAGVAGPHVFTHMDFMYYYVKWPFLLFLAGYGLSSMAGPRVGEGPSPRPDFACWGAIALASASLALTAWLLFAS